MAHGINLNSITPLRSETSDRSEMVSQLLFGETFTYEKAENGFCRIFNKFDNYEGFVDSKMIIEITETEYDELSNQPTHYVAIPLAEAFDLTSKCIIRIPAGSKLPNCGNTGRFGYHDKMFQIHRDFILPESEIAKEGLHRTAISFLNAPYLWGGKTVMGMDCSGFTQVVFRLHGYRLPRDSKDQALEGTEIPLGQAKAGDLVFFENQAQKVVHVGILLENNKIIHSSGRVRIDRLDEKGIYSDELEKYTHQFHSVRRI